MTGGRDITRQERLWPLFFLFFRLPHRQRLKKLYSFAVTFYSLKLLCLVHLRFISPTYLQLDLATFNLAVYSSQLKSWLCYRMAG